MNTGTKVIKLRKYNIEYFRIWLPGLQVNFNPFMMNQFCYSSNDMHIL